MSYWRGKRAIVTGGSAGLGRAFAHVLVQLGARVAIVARSEQALAATAQELQAAGGNVLTASADVTRAEEVERLSSTIHSAWDGVDLLCHCAGKSMRGTVLATPASEFRDLIDINFMSAVHCTQAFAEPLIQSRGHLVFIGSLASKVAAGYLGAYPSSKFPLGALAQQLRMELGPKGLHTLLVCPGPIAREGGEAETRYAKQDPNVPAAAHQPGGGAKVRAIDPKWLSERILRACELRRAELVVPRYARLLFAASQLSPRFGDWCLRKMTS
jgi:short-subunit dehydrogenase